MLEICIVVFYIYNVMIFGTFIAVISSCTTHDSGVYAFVAQPPKSERIVLKLYAVSINDKPKSVYIGDVVRVQCNAATLSYLFSGLSQKWLINDSFVIKNYGINPLALVLKSF